MSGISKIKKYTLGIAATVLMFLVLGYTFFSPLVKYEIGKFTSSRAKTTAGAAVTRLDVSYHRQEHSLSCELASLKMVLNYYGVNVSESEIIEKLAFDTTPKTRTTWGDPSVGFVGNIDGKMGKTGYGVYYGPVAEVARNWKYADAMNQLTAQDVANHIERDRPLVVWGYYGSGKRLSWSTPEGKKIYAVNGEHARVVIGFTGSALDPEGFILLDPIYGEIYWTTEQFMKNFASFDNSAVVVYR